MKGKILTLLLVLAMMGATAYATENQSKQNKKERQKARIEKLINAKKFQFEARQANPLGGKTIDLTTNPNFVNFYPDRIKADMPYFGRAYYVPYGGPGGIKFDGKPDSFKITQQKKNRGYLIQANVKNTQDIFMLTLSVSYDGYGTLTINSNNRNTISYYGEISPIPNDKRK